MRDSTRHSCSVASSSTIGLHSSLKGQSTGTRRLRLPSALAAAALSLKSRSLARRVRRGSETLLRELEESQEVREEVRPCASANRVPFARTKCMQSILPSMRSILPLAEGSTGRAAQRILTRRAAAAFPRAQLASRVVEQVVDVDKKIMLLKQALRATRSGREGRIPNKGT